MPNSPIDGRTQLVGLIGWPVEHSMSPAMHNAAFAARELNWRYVPLSAPPGQVDVAIRGLAALGFRGVNVTVPHKRAARLALTYLYGPEAVAPHVAALGAVNTLVVERDEHGDTTTTGHNTDLAGFLGALRDGGFEPRGTSAVVVGAGGAARAVVFGLLHAQAETITVLNRTQKRAEALVSDLVSAPGTAPPRTLQALPLTQETLVPAVRDAQLLVNATSLGMWPRVDRSIWPDEVPLPSHLTVFDLVYNPLKTKLGRQAQAAGARSMGGLGMLVRQGALAFEMWTGQDAPVHVMRKACERSLQTQAPL